jgi:hypothetical protein
MHESFPILVTAPGMCPKSENSYYNEQSNYRKAFFYSDVEKEVFHTGWLSIEFEKTFERKE